MRIPVHGKKQEDAKHETGETFAGYWIAMLGCRTLSAGGAFVFFFNNEKATNNLDEEVPSKLSLCGEVLLVLLMVSGCVLRLRAEENLSFDGSGLAVTDWAELLAFPIASLAFTAVLYMYLSLGLVVLVLSVGFLFSLVFYLHVFVFHKNDNRFQIASSTMVSIASIMAILLLTWAFFVCVMVTSTGNMYETIFVAIVSSVGIGVGLWRYTQARNLRHSAKSRRSRDNTSSFDGSFEEETEAHNVMGQGQREALCTVFCVYVLLCGASAW